MEEENTHIIFDGKRVVVSPNLQQVFFFFVRDWRRNR